MLFVRVVERVVDSGDDGALGLGIRGVDFDFLEEEDFWEVVAVEECAEGC